MFVIRLLQRNARVATAGADRNTPLHLAAMKGFTNVAKKLIDNGAYVAAENKDGHNPLYLAIEKDYCDFAVLMVNNMEPARYLHAAICTFNTILITTCTCAMGRNRVSDW